MPSQCRANDGTELVGRYDRRMDQWVPLFVAVVGAVAAVGVAFWNSRGESAELRQLKAMNEVLSGLDAETEGAKTFVSARDELLVRVAARVSSAPTRRSYTLIIAGGVVAIAGIVVTLWLTVPAMTDAQAAALGNIFLIVVALGGLGMGWLLPDAIGTSAAKAGRRARRRLEARRAKADPGGGRSA